MQGNLSSSVQSKYENFKSILHEMDRVVVAFSGGVDSSLVAFVANRELSYERVLSVTSASSSLKRSDLNLTKDLAKKWGLRHEVILTDELEKPEYRANPINRCFHCKTSLYTSLSQLALERNYDHVLNGTNVDDLGDHRPGLIAAENFNIRAPLCESGFTKADIRELAECLGMENAHKPQAACLSSRVPYGSSIDESVLRQIESAENVLAEYGFVNYRVRHHDDVARLEIAVEEFPKALELANELSKQIKLCGYRFVSLDLAGFRSGSLNESIINTIRIGN